MDVVVPAEDGEETPEFEGVYVGSYGIEGDAGVVCERGFEARRGYGGGEIGRAVESIINRVY